MGTPITRPARNAGTVIRASEGGLIGWCSIALSQQSIQAVLGHSKLDTTARYKGQSHFVRTGGGEGNLVGGGATACGVGCVVSGRMEEAYAGSLLSAGC